MNKLTMILTAAGAVALWSAPAAAQNSQQTNSVNAPVGGVLTIFGNDPCPQDTICVRAPETDRYRIPTELREPGENNPRNQSWAVRQQDALTTGGSGTGSCSTVGPGGQTGCFVQDATRGRAETRQRERRTNDLPLP